MEDSLLRSGVVAALTRRRITVTVLEGALTPSLPEFDAVVEFVHQETPESTPSLTISSPVLVEPITQDITTTTTARELLQTLTRAVASPLPPVKNLSQKEREVVTLLASGHSTEEIAALCFISTDTVKTHLSRIYKKLGAKNRAAAVNNALMLGQI